MTAAPSHRDYIPALRFRWLTQFFDPLMAAAFDGARLRDRLIAQARIASGHRVLDLGCGGRSSWSSRSATLTSPQSAWAPITRFLGSR